MRRVPIRFISVLGLVAVGGVRGAVAAEEKAGAAPARTPAAEQGIAGAKRDFDTVKAARDPALQPKGAMPRVGAPEMHTEPPSGGWKQQKNQTGTLEKKSSNWLVDAMEKSDPRRKAANEKGARENPQDPARDKETDLADPLRAQTEEAAPRDEKEAREEPERNPERTVVNPLNQFLGSWMTPKDYALLKPGLEAAAKPGDPSLAGLAGGGASAVPSPAAEAGLPAGLPAVPAGGPPAPRENPFLQSLNAPAPASPATVFTPPPASMMPAMRSAPTVAPPLPPPVVAPAPKPQVPDFARPAADDKYFKPLKRF